MKVSKEMFSSKARGTIKLEEMSGRVPFCAHRLYFTPPRSEFTPHLLQNVRILEPPSYQQKMIMLNSNNFGKKFRESEMFGGRK
jgi:hypothetical protein